MIYGNEVVRRSQVVNQAHCPMGGREMLDTPFAAKIDVTVRIIVRQGVFVYIAALYVYGYDKSLNPL